MLIITTLNITGKQRKQGHMDGVLQANLVTFVCVILVGPLASEHSGDDVFSGFGIDITTRDGNAFTSGGMQ